MHGLSVSLTNNPVSLAHKQLGRLQRQVEDLQGALFKSLHDRQSAPIIIHSGGRSG